MDRALDPALIATALSDASGLPSATELAELIAEAELSILLRQPKASEDLFAAGWYLHGVASSRVAMELYGVARVRACFRVAAHIFDIALRSTDFSQSDRLKFGFASQVAYLRSELDPNAIALYERHFNNRLNTQSALVEGAETTALTLGVALLGMDTRFVLDYTRPLIEEIRALPSRWGIESYLDTVYAGPATVAIATRAICVFLLYGDRRAAERASSTLTRLLAEPSDGDEISRWVAYHLRALFEGLDRASLWTSLPPVVPREVRRAFATTTPRVLTLWPPQLELFAPTPQPGTGISPSPLEATRVFLATPTSSGKTLIAQLMIASHLLTATTGVCYVAPTRTLCNEVRKVLDRRLRYMRKLVSAEEESLALFEPGQTLPDVAVMTPERFSSLLRVGAKSVLERFGMFVFDEVHNVGDPDRGWTLESALTYLHSATTDTPHKLVVMSAAIGNQNHFVTWLAKHDERPYPHSSDWRGPRRMHCIWTTAVDWNREKLERGRSAKYPRLQTYPLHGQLHVRLSPTGEERTLSTTESIGTLAYYLDPRGVRHGLAARASSAQTVLPIIEHLGAGGPVLIIEGSRFQTIQLAKQLAEFLEDRPITESAGLSDLVRLRLGDDHPLVPMLRRGVAYHHGSLPTEIRLAIEDAVREGALQYLVATTTMTEGVNLPVHAVVVATQGTYTADGFKEFISGAKLVNAVGRAGRATRETEGVVVLVLNRKYSPHDFKRLDPDEEEFHANSLLVTKAALEELALFEQMQLAAQDAVISFAGNAVSSFLSFVWFVSTELERLGTPVTVEGVENVLSRSLAWVQLDATTRHRWISVVSAAVSRYDQTPPATRRRWASSDRSLESAIVLEQAARRLLDQVQTTHSFDSETVFQLLLGEDSLAQLSGLREAPRRRVYNRRSGSTRTDVTPPLQAVLFDWIRGAELSELAERHFAAVIDTDYRFEQLGDFVNDFFEVYLPSVLATVIGWANEILHEEGLGLTALLSLPTELPLLVRHGVNDRTAAELMVGGLTSRRLALAISLAHATAAPAVGVRAWLGAMTTEDLRARFSPSGPELRDLLDFTRSREKGIAAELFAGGRARLSFQSLVETLEQQAASLLHSGAAGFPRISVIVKENVVGYVTSDVYSDLAALIASGFSFSAVAVAVEAIGLLELELLPPDQDFFEE